MEFPARSNDFHPDVPVSHFYEPGTKKWSLETGCDSPPFMFGCSDIDFFSAPPSDPFVNGSPATGMRPITKRTKRITDEMEANIQRLAQELADFQLQKEFADFQLQMGLAYYQMEMAEKQSSMEKHYLSPIPQSVGYTDLGNVTSLPVTSSSKYGHRRASKNKKGFGKKISSVKGCEFCRNSGFAGWENHQCKNSKGETVCPILLDWPCEKCWTIGHTKRHCPIELAKKQARIEQELQERQMRKQALRESHRHL